jgi:uncharacterized membrane protein YccC
MLATQKLLLFHTACLAARIGILLLYFFFPSIEISIIAFVIGSGFLFQWLRFSKESSLATTGAFGSTVYWPRFFHFFTYYTAATLMLIEKTHSIAYIPLIVDITIGWMIVCYHYLHHNKTPDMNNVFILGA